MATQPSVLSWQRLGCPKSAEPVSKGEGACPEASARTGNRHRLQECGPGRSPRFKVQLCHLRSWVCKLQLPDPVTFPYEGDLGECKRPGPSYIHELGGPSSPQALGRSMESLPAQGRSASPGRVSAQRLVLDGDSRASWSRHSCGRSLRSPVAPPCPLTSQLQRQWLSRGHVGVQRSPSTGGWQRR